MYGGHWNPCADNCIMYVSFKWSVRTVHTCAYIFNVQSWYICACNANFIFDFTTLHFCLSFSKLTSCGLLKVAYINFQRKTIIAFATRNCLYVCFCASACAHFYTYWRDAGANGSNGMKRRPRTLCCKGTNKPKIHISCLRDGVKRQQHWARFHFSILCAEITWNSNGDVDKKNNVELDGSDKRQQSGDSGRRDHLLWYRLQPSVRRNKHSKFHSTDDV